MNHAYTVEFRIYSKTLDAARIAHVTLELGLNPSRTDTQGERRARDGKELTGMWGFDGADHDLDGDWNSLEDGLRAFLDVLEPLTDKIRTVAEDADLVWWCGHFQASFDGGPQLSATLLRRLGDFGATLYIDNYFSSGEESVSAE